MRVYVICFTAILNAILVPAARPQASCAILMANLLLCLDKKRHFPSGQDLQRRPDSPVYGLQETEPPFSMSASGYVSKSRLNFTPPMTQLPGIGAKPDSM